MNLFDQLISQTMKNQGELAPLRIVIEKELLHHDILREMSGAGLLDSLTFIGGTCLRSCYGSNRLSEDLDFTGGNDFKPVMLSDLSSVLRTRTKITWHFKRRCIPPDCVAKAQNILIFLRFRALPDGRLNT